MVVGDQKKYLGALLTLKSDNQGFLDKETKRILQDKGSDVATVVDATNDDITREYIQSAIDRYNEKAVSKRHLLRNYMILHHDFSIGSNELTANLKIKRNTIYQKYKNEIDSLYYKTKF